MYKGRVLGTMGGREEGEGGEVGELGWIVRSVRGLTIRKWGRGVGRGRWNAQGIG